MVFRLPLQVLAIILIIFGLVILPPKKRLAQAGACPD